jgi:cytochrome c-type biogenesis protein CcmH/NrfG
MNPTDTIAGIKRSVSTESSLLSVALATLITLGTYAVMAAPDTAFAFSKQADVTETGTTIELGRSNASISQLVDGLSDSLQANPDDPSGWLLLARAYDHLGRTEEAVDAYQQASSMGATDEALEFALFHTETSLN